MKVVRRLFFLCALIVLALGGYAFAQDKSCTAEHYKIIALPLLPRHVGNSSEVVGTTEAHGAAIWTEQGGLKDLGVPAGFTVAEAVSVNNAGHAVGFATNTASTKRQGFRYADGKVSLFAGSQSRAYAINEADQIAGEAALSGKGEVNPVIWRGQTPTDLGACCGGTTVALNNRGQAVGSMYDREGRYHAFVWDAINKLQPLGPQDDFSAALAINDAGHIIVDGFSRGSFLYEDGKPTRLQLSAKYNGRPTAMNNCDAIVGAAGPYSDAESAFVWDKKHGFRDLNDLVPPKSGWKLEHASSINDKGEIVGWGDHDGDEDAGFLLVPQ